MISTFRNIGIHPDLAADEVVKIRLINTVFLMMFSLTSIFGLISLVDLNLKLLSIVGINFFLQLIPIYLVHKRYYVPAYYFTIIVFSIVFAVLNLFTSNDAGHEFVFLMIIYLVYIFFENNLTRFILVSIIVSLSLLSSYFHSLIPLELTIVVMDYYFIKELLFLLYVVWVGYLINNYHHEVINNKKKQHALIGKLQIKNEKIKELSNEMERFNHIASHDLKSPLRNIISFLGLAKRKLKQKKYDEISTQIQYVNNASEQMGILVTDILTFSKINQEEILTASVDLNEVVNVVIKELQPLITSKNGQVIKGNLPNIKGNQQEIKTLFYQLISNGLKYNTSKKPTVYITHSENHEQLILEFKDNGIGIEEVYQSQIFEYFKRLHTYKKHKGSGLGLGICQKITRKMDGVIELKSTKNVGSTFIIRLPKKLSN